MDFTYKIMFFTGVLYAFVSFIIGGISGALHFGSHIDSSGGHVHIGSTNGGIDGYSGDTAGHHAHGDAAGAGSAQTLLSWVTVLFNPIVAVSFATVFGGIGILGTRYLRWPAVSILVLALAVGTITAFSLYKFIAKPLYRSNNSSEVSRDSLIGTTAEVSTEILENGFGTIKYSVNSIRYTAPARHTDGKLVKQGRKVIICRIESNVFYVTEMEELQL